MPEQKPSSFSISRSYSVRWRSRCASSIFPSRVELRHLLLQLGADVVDGPLDRGRRRDVLRRRPDDEVLERRHHLARERVEVRDRLHVVAEERDAMRGLRVGGLHLHHVALHAEAAAAQHRVVAHVLALDELAQRRVAIVRLPHLEDQHPLLPLLGRADAVDARDGGDDDDVAPRHQRGRGGEPQARRCRRSGTSPSRCRGRPGARTPRAGSSRSTRRSTRRRSRGRTRGTRCRAAPRASCCGR